MSFLFSNHPQLYSNNVEFYFFLVEIEDKRFIIIHIFFLKIKLDLLTNNIGLNIYKIHLKKYIILTHEILLLISYDCTQACINLTHFDISHVEFSYIINN